METRPCNRMVFGVAVGLWAASLAPGCGDHGPPPAPPKEAVKVEELVAEAKAKFEKLDAERRAGLVEAYDKPLVPRPDLGRCPYEIKSPLGMGSAYDAKTFEAKLRAMERLSLLDFPTRETLAEEHGPLYTAALNRLRVGPSTRLPDVEKKIAEVEDPAWLDFDVVVVEESREDAEAAGEDSYRGGTFAGRAFLWSFRERKVACMATVNSKLTGRIHARKTFVGDEEIHDSFKVSAILGLQASVLKHATTRLYIAGEIPSEAGDEPETLRAKGARE